MSSINFQRTYLLNESYESIKERVFQIAPIFQKHPTLITFNDPDRSITFSSERLIPAVSTLRPRIMLLFSNPHPYSVHQGMFLSPSTKGRENLFWTAMRDAGWITLTEEKPTLQQLADICLKVEYQGPFELIFNCYYAFPTAYPEDISKIFGKEYFERKIAPEARDEFMKTLQETNVEAVLTFNKGIFNLVSKDPRCAGGDPIDSYVERLIKGEVIQSQINDIDQSIPIYLTFPTGWRYRKQYKQYRKESLDAIRIAICSGASESENKNI
jgi:hypothetical protein